jgi:cell division protein FtsN
MISHKKQAGNTFLGIVIGLIIGLLIAVIVALVITKTPVPFISRSAKEKTPEPASSQISDPNKGMYGNKDAAKDAAKDFAKEQAAAQAQAAAPVDSKTATKLTTKEEAKPAADKPKEATAKTETSDDKYTFFLQVGAFRDQADAEGTKAKLALQGFESQISERTSETGVLYRVRLGPYGQIDAMNKIRSRLSENGVDVAVVRVPK